MTTDIIHINLIRHGKTPGNLEGRYIGARTDEALAGAGIQELKMHQYPKVSKVYASPMKRCLETAAIIYPDYDATQIQVIEELRETDFGIFEGKNYQELQGDDRYQAWIDSMGELPFPQGESREQVRSRVLEAFRSIRKQCQEAQSPRQGLSESAATEQSIAIIAHGGTIMTLLEQLFGGNYFDYQIKNGEGYSFDISYDGICSGLRPRSYHRGPRAVAPSRAVDRWTDRNADEDIFE